MELPDTMSDVERLMHMLLEKQAEITAVKAERDRLRENLAVCYGNLMDADQRIKELEAKS